ncbi:hypothetical protein [Candidatus Nitrosocosmicus sp. R]
MALVELLRLAALFKEDGDPLYKGITRNKWDLTFEDGCSKQSSFGAHGFSNRGNKNESGIHIL